MLAAVFGAWRGDQTFPLVSQALPSRDASSDSVTAAFSADVGLSQDPEVNVLRDRFGHLALLAYLGPNMPEYIRCRSTTCSRACLRHMN